MDGPVKQSTEESVRRVNREAIFSKDSYREPETVAQRVMTHIWADALNLDRVGLEDDFFALGGESVAATVICAETQRVTGRRAAPSLLLDAPTILTFAATIDADLFDQRGSIIVASRTSGTLPPLVLVHGLDGNIFFTRHLSWVLSAEQPVYGVQARGMDGISNPHESVDEMARDYAVEIFREIGTRPFFLGGFCIGGVIAIEVMRHLVNMGANVMRLIMIDPPPRPFKRRKDPADYDQDTIEIVRGQKIAMRVEELANGLPDIVAHYQPGGAGYQNALRVSQALMRAYARFVPRWTRMPTTIVWSIERAKQRRARLAEYPLTRGPTDAIIVRNGKFYVSHQLLMSEGLKVVADILRKEMQRATETGHAPVQVSQ